MARGGGDVDALLSEPEVDQGVHARLRRRRLGECPAQVAHRDLSGAADEGAVGRHAQGVDHERVAGRRDEVEVCGDAFRLGLRRRQQLRRAAVSKKAVGRIDRLVDGRPHDRMDELDRRRRDAEQVGAREPRRGERREVAIVEVRERRNVALLRAVAEHRRRGREAPGLVGQP